MGLEASYAFMGRGGIDRYALELFRALLARRDGYQYVLFTMFAPFRRPDLEGAPLRLALRRKLAMAQIELMRHSWSRLGWPRVEMFTGPVDVFHCVHHFAVPVRRAKVVCTVHDLSFEYPEFAIENAARYSRDTRSAIRRADLVIAVSGFTKAELMAHYDLPPERVRVVAEGVALTRWAADGPSWSAARAPYFLAVGKIEPRKNLVELVEGFALARAELRLPHRLVIVGKAGRHGTALLERIRSSRAAPYVDYLAFVPDEQLLELYRAATALVYPSLYEGFGLPVLEAMAAGTAVIASRAASLPEVVGEAGLLVTPGDPGRWAEALGRLACEDDLRAALVAKGSARAKEFTWEAAAARTVGLYEDLGVS